MTVLSQQTHFIPTTVSLLNVIVTGNPAGNQIRARLKSSCFTSKQSRPIAHQIACSSQSCQQLEIENCRRFQPAHSLYSGTSFMLYNFLRSHSSFSYLALVFIASFPLLQLIVLFRVQITVLQVLIIIAFALLLWLCIEEGAGRDLGTKFGKLVGFVFVFSVAFETLISIYGTKTCGSGSS
jgi:hypothetical protein